MDAALFSAHTVNSYTSAVEGQNTLPDGSELIFALSRKEFGPMSFNGRPEWDVAHNRMQFLKAFNLRIDHVVAAGLQHTANVQIVTQADRRRGARELSTAISDTDALLTNESDVILMTTHADCLPVWLATPDSGWIGLAHAGWRGVATGIVPAMINSIPESDRKNVTIAIGPGISGKHYEVGSKLVEQFQSDELLAPAILKMNGKPHIDLATAVANQAEAAGATVVRSFSACTYETPYLSSFRRDGKDFAPMSAFIVKRTNEHHKH